MQQLFFYVFIIILTATSCVSTKNKNYNFNNKYATSAFKKDVLILKDVLEKHHPSLYWYTSKESLDSAFQYLLQGQIKDSLTETACRNKLQQIVSKIKCGHTTVRFSKQYNKVVNKYLYPCFPLQLKTWSDSLVVLARYNVADSMLKPGTVITSINNKKPSEILSVLFTLLSTDGYAINHKSQVLSGNFPMWYSFGFGLDSVYKIGYINSFGKEEFVKVQWFKPMVDTSKKNIAKQIDKVKTPKQTLKEQRQVILLSKRKMVVDCALHTAYIKLTSFSIKNLPAFFKQSFKEIEKQQITNVVVDIRENGGGRVRNAILLTKYLHQLAFKVGDTVASKKPSLLHSKYIPFNWAYTLAKIFGSKKMEDGLWHNRVYETKYYAPKNKYHFKGNIYIVQGGYTFSAATLFAGWLKHQSNVTIIGEESGGAYYGNSAMFIPTIYLPNTKLRVSLPLYKLVMDKDRPKGNGIKPDIIIPPSSFAIQKGVDKKLDYVRQLIKQKTIN